MKINKKEEKRVGKTRHTLLLAQPAHWRQAFSRVLLSTSHMLSSHEPELPPPEPSPPSPRLGTSALLA